MLYPILTFMSRFPPFSMRLRASCTFLPHILRNHANDPISAGLVYSVANLIISLGRSVANDSHAARPREIIHTATS